MCVHVEDRLAGARTGVEHEPELAMRVLCGQRVRRRHQLRKQPGVARRQLDDVAVLLRLGHDEQVNRGLGRDVAERDDSLTVEHDVGRDLARDDAREDRALVRCHTSILRAL